MKGALATNAEDNLSFTEIDAIASEALAKEPEDWKTVFRRMWANNEFDDKFSKTLEFTYAFQKGFKAALEDTGKEDDQLK